MSTYWRQRIKSALIIVGLVTFILVVISICIAFKNGVFTHNSTDVNSEIRFSQIFNQTNTRSQVKFDDDPYASPSSLSSSLSSNSSASSSSISSSSLQSVDNFDNSINIITSNTAETQFEEFIKPSKIHLQPLNAQDLLYESKKFGLSANIDEQIVDHRQTGHYRSKSNRIWDPHPQYLIDAFGLHFHLILYQDGSFIPKDMKITHSSQKELFFEEENNFEREALRGCFYKGRVRGDDLSVVSVSLCNGMRGHIYTSTGSYFIQPVEKYTVDNPNVLHKITRKVTNINEQQSNENSKCEVCDSKECDDNYENMLTNDTQSFRSRRRRHVSEGSYTMEVLVGVDMKMQKYHEHDLRDYILTLMSIVSNIFSYASIGNSINIAVSQILQLKDDLKVETTPYGISAKHTLGAFCKHVQKYQFHYDTALLLTREQLCRDAKDGVCDTLGLAEVGTVCRRSSCSIVQDTGLGAAFSIAHELGHTLSMPHDNDAKCEKFQKSDKKELNIMSRSLDKETNPWSWSTCSRHYLTKYLEHNKGACMLDEPKYNMMNVISNKEMFPGEKYNIDKQCEFLLPGTTMCHHEDQYKCNMILCGKGTKEACRVFFTPWADGTECDRNYWCQKGKCVPKNRLALKKIDGGWGSWSSYSECSRTCGGGIQSSTRECDSPVPLNNGKYCTGPRTRHKACNKQQCPLDEPDFREMQCAKFNGDNGGVQNISTSETWIPKYGVEGGECILYCRPDKVGNYFELKDKVIDGTPCTHDGFNRCVNGVCRPAGCDGELNANTTLDKCGVCGGNNDTCIDIHGSFTVQQLEQSRKMIQDYYFVVAKIPKGASNIEIIQRGYINDHNYIVIARDNGSYLFNGQSVVTPYSRTFAYGGVTIEYTGTNVTIERVNTTYARRITRDLIVMLLSRSNKTVSDDVLSYSYTVALNESSTLFHPYQEDAKTIRQQLFNRYQWQMSEWSMCDRICNGKRHRTAACVHNGTTVALRYCPRPKSIIEYENCNVNCLVNWESTRSECSRVCGDGVRTITHRCIQRINNTNLSYVVDDSHCPSASKPDEYEKCIGSCKTATWTYNEWSPCSKSCGLGTKSRAAYCRSHSNGYVIDDMYCAELQREELITPCKLEDCPVWSYGEYTPCSVTCGQGKRSSAIYCKQNNFTVNRALCSYLPPLIEVTKNCTMEPCQKKVPASIATLHADEVLPTTLDNNVYADETHTSTSTIIPDVVQISYKWRTNRWSPCSTTCGAGTKIRSVICINATTSIPVPVPNQYCIDDEPVNVTICDIRTCPIWTYTAWTKCNTNCKRNRTVLCRNETDRVDDIYCPPQKPAAFEECCTFEWGSVYTPCSSSCGFGTKKERKVCKRVHMRNVRTPSPRKRKKRGQIVDQSYCSHLPKPQTKDKICESQCRRPKWESTNWTQCNVGCGQGYSTRDVKCVLGKKVLNDSYCDPTQKPIKIRQCEFKEYCKWKEGPWKKCSCAGYRKRNITCYDTKLNRLSTSCSEPRIKQKKRCIPPPNCSCRGIRLRLGTQVDGEYDLIINSKKIKIYCHKMNTQEPIEFLTLPTRDNYAMYYERRSRDSNQCPSIVDNGYYDGTIPSGMTYYSKVRLNLSNLQIIEDDYQFASTTGPRPQTYGSAGDCYSITERCPQGRFFINLEGTKFRINPQTKWDIKGQNSTMVFSIKLEYPYKKVAATCGGYCGSCNPSTGIKLEVD